MADTQVVQDHHRCNARLVDHLERGGRFGPRSGPAFQRVAEERGWDEHTVPQPLAETRSTLKNARFLHAQGARAQLPCWCVWNERFAAWTGNERFQNFED